MMLEGKIVRDGKWWAAEVPAAGIYTQGKSRKAAKAMIVDAVRSLLDRPAYEVAVSDHGEGGGVLVEAAEPGPLLAYVLRYQRETQGMSLGQVATALGASSRSAFARYEQGTSEPTIGKLVELLQAVAPGLAFALVARTT